MPPDVAFSLGGVLYRFESEGVVLQHDADPAYRSFLLHPPFPVGSRDTVSVRFSVSPSPASPGRTIFRSSASWTMLAEDGDRAFLFRQPDGAPLYLARFRPGGPDVSVVCAERMVEAHDGATFLRNPFVYPLDQVVSLYLLAGRGLTIHAAGALVSDRGVVLAGVSGAGKTTISRLAAGREGWEPLSDDRVIVRLDEAAATVYGTPWPGEGDVAENRYGPLQWLVFLSQGETNGVERLEPDQALKRLLTTASVPWYDEHYLGRVLDACGRLVRQVPAALLTFRPDGGAIDAVEGLLAGRA
jgi:hypothetical protein